VTLFSVVLLPPLALAEIVGRNPATAWGMSSSAARTLARSAINEGLER